MLKNCNMSQGSEGSCREPTTRCAHVSGSVPAPGANDLTPLRAKFGGPGCAGYGTPPVTTASSTTTWGLAIPTETAWSNAAQNAICRRWPKASGTHLSARSTIRVEPCNSVPGHYSSNIHRGSLSRLNRCKEKYAMRLTPTFMDMNARLWQLRRWSGARPYLQPTTQTSR